MSQFDELLAQLQAQADEQVTLAKSLPAEDGEDDEAIQAAAGDGAEEGTDDEAEEGAEDGNEEGEEPLGKSMTAMINGEEVEAVDATDLIKSLIGRLDNHGDVMAKALATTLGTIKTQGDMIKSLSSRLEKLAGQGRGRKAVLSVNEKPSPGETTMVKSVQPAPGEIMAKAMTAQQAGKLTAGDVARCEISLQSGVAFPADVLAKI